MDMFPVSKMKRVKKEAHYKESVKRKQKRKENYSDDFSAVNIKNISVKKEIDDIFPYDPSDESSDSDCGLAPSSYLHDKIGIYVQDDSGSTQDKTQLVKLLPVDFGVVIVSYVGEESIDNRPCFSCSLRLNITDKDTILRWLKLFEQKSFTIYRVDSTFKCEKSKKLVFKKNFRCQNNQYVHQNRKKENTRKKRIEHTGCPAKVSLTIKQQEMQRTTDTYLKEYPAVINIRFNHNHDSRTEREMHKIFRKPKKRIFEEKKEIEEIKIIEVGDVKEIMQSDLIQHKTIQQNSIEEKKVSLVNNDWSDVLCEDVFLERSNNSMCMHKESETSPYEDTLVEIERCCNVLKQKTIEKPEMFHLPLMNFLEVFNSFKTDSDLATALTSFGRYSETVISYKKDVDLRSNVTDVPVIPDVQRKVYTGAYKMERNERLYVSTSEHPYFRLS